MTSKAHWEGVYNSKAVDEVSWYRPHLEVSLRLIEGAAPDRGSAIIDVGGGEATLDRRQCLLLALRGSSVTPGGTLATPRRFSSRRPRPRLRATIGRDLDSLRADAALEQEAAP